MKLYLDTGNGYPVFTISILFILPALLVLSNIFYPNIAHFFQIWLNNQQIGIHFVFYFQIIVLVIMLLVYPIYPAIFPTEEYFHKVGDCNAIFEYTMLKKTIYVLASFFIVGSALIKILFLISRRQFRYYFAKAYFTMLLRAEDETEKMRYLIEVSNSYNKYLRRNLGLQGEENLKAKFQTWKY